MDQQAADTFSVLSDEELAKLAADDRSALTALIVRYNPLISSKAYSMKTDETDADDLFQEGIMGLLDAVRTYREGKGASFKTYANVCVRNRMINSVSKNGQRVPLEDAEETGGSDEDPESIVVQMEHEKLLFERITGMLTAAEWNTLRLYLGGAAYSDIADRLGTSVKSVDNAMQRVRKKLRAVLLP